MNKLCPVDVPCQSNADSGGTARSSRVPDLRARYLHEWAIYCLLNYGTRSPYYCAQLVCVLNFLGGSAVWRLYKQTNKPYMRCSRGGHPFWERTDVHRYPSEWLVCVVILVIVVTGGSVDSRGRQSDSFGIEYSFCDCKIAPMDENAGVNQLKF